MKKIDILKQINGLKKDYKEIIKLDYFKQFKKDIQKIDDFTTKIDQTNDITTKTQKISINASMLNNFKALANEICNDDTNNIINKATNNQIKKSLALAIFDNTTNNLKLQIKTNAQALYNYQDITRVFTTFKATIENLKTQNKTMSVCVDLVTNKVKFVDADALYQKMLEQKELEKQNAKIAKSNKKAKENKKASNN